jgi:hypothetical protein
MSAWALAPSSPAYGLWMVAQKLPTLSVVCTFAKESMRGTSTQHLRLDEEQREDLRRLQDELGRQAPTDRPSPRSRTYRELPLCLLFVY